MKYKWLDKVLFRNKVWQIVEIDSDSIYCYKLVICEVEPDTFEQTKFWVREQDLIDISNIEEARRWFLQTKS